MSGIEFKRAVDIHALKILQWRIKRDGLGSWTSVGIYTTMSETEHAGNDAVTCCSGGIA